MAQAFLSGGPFDGTRIEPGEFADTVTLVDEDGREHIYRYDGSMLPTDKGFGIPIFAYGGLGEATYAGPFVMTVAEVWNITGRGQIITGPVQQGFCRVGDALELSDEQGVTTAVVTAVEMHVRPGELGLVLGDVVGDLREGQTARCRGD